MVVARGKKGVSIWLVKQQPNHNHSSEMAHTLKMVIIWIQDYRCQDQYFFRPENDEFSVQWFLFVFQQLMMLYD